MPSFSIPSFSGCCQRIKIFLCRWFNFIILIHFLEVSGGRGFMCWIFHLLFRLWMGIIYMYIYPLPVFTTQISRRNRSGLEMMLLCWIFCTFWNIMSGSWWYTTINMITIFIWFTSILIIWKIDGGCMSTMSIFFMVGIFCWRMKLPLSYSTIVLCGTCSFLWMLIVLWIIFKIPMWLMVYKQTKTNFQ